MPVYNERRPRDELPNSVARAGRFPDDISSVSDNIDLTSHTVARPTPEIIITCLEWAGQVLLSTHIKSPKPADYRVFWPEFPQDPNEAYGYTGERLRPPVPGSTDIELMDVIYTWLVLVDDIPARRVVCARSLVTPISERYLYPWTRIAILLSSDRFSVKRLHRRGIKRIVERIELTSVRAVVAEIIK